MIIYKNIITTECNSDPSSQAAREQALAPRTSVRQELGLASDPGTDVEMELSVDQSSDQGPISNYEDECDPRSIKS